MQGIFFKGFDRDIEVGVIKKTSYQTLSFCQ